jgi:hypothetical protein
LKLAKVAAVLAAPAAGAFDEDAPPGLGGSA